MSTTDQEPVESIESVELVPVDPPPAAASLFLTSDPRLFLERAGEAADALAAMIRKQKLSVRIRGREHVLVEGWTALGSLLGVFPVTEWTKRIDDGWEARVVARTRAGELVGAAESMCTTKESRWRAADDYAVRSMAATRATSKALRQPLGFVMALAGFDTTPLEEIPPEPATPEPSPSEPKRERPTTAQKQDVDGFIVQLQEFDEALAREPTDWQAWMRDYAEVERWADLDAAGATRLIHGLERLVVQRTAELLRQEREADDGE